jgi:hypothetical protein
LDITLEPQKILFSGFKMIKFSQADPGIIDKLVREQALGMPISAF